MGHHTHSADLMKGTIPPSASYVKSREDPQYEKKATELVLMGLKEKPRVGVRNHDQINATTLNKRIKELIAEAFDERMPDIADAVLDAPIFHPMKPNKEMEDFVEVQKKLTAAMTSAMGVPQRLLKGSAHFDLDFRFAGGFLLHDEMPSPSYFPLRIVCGSGKMTEAELKSWAHSAYDPKSGACGLKKDYKRKVTVRDGTGRYFTLDGAWCDRSSGHSHVRFDKVRRVA